jgi:glutathione S-transferase
MAGEDGYIIYGALGSPYSMKMRALMRYRRLPHVWVTGRKATQAAMGEVKVPVIPVLRYPDGTYHNDSTPLIYDLERRHAERSVLPADPAQAFLAYLIEDFADEWMTKPMFFHRWHLDVDQQQMSRWLGFDAYTGTGRANIEEYAAKFRDRQVGRMPIVGCTQENRPLIEASCDAVLQALDDHVTDNLFLFGSRPSLAEFGLFGQISQLATDPTPDALMRGRFPWAYRWVLHVDDLSGHEGEWLGAEAALPDVVIRLLTVIGAVYLPFLAANAQATEAGAETVEFEAMGHGYSQAPFRYQAKCLRQLREAWAALSADARARLEGPLGETGCLETLAG